jgi:hypothetical protein
MDIVSIGTAYTSLQLIRDSIGLALNAKVDEQTRVKIHAAMDHITKLQDGLFQTQQQLLTLQQENEALRNQLAAAHSWQARGANYRLVQAVGGAMVYEYQGVPHHFACPKCFEDERISILQHPGGRYSGRWPCMACAQYYNVTVAEPINVSGLGGHLA